MLNTKRLVGLMGSHALSTKLYTVMMPQFTVVICCANSGSTLPAAIASVEWADELIIVDSGSDDNTGEIAAAAADRYVIEPWRGYAGQKIFALTLASHDWVLILDGDEEVSPHLARQIQKLSDAQLETLDVVSVCRQNWILGRVVRQWNPDRQARLIHRGRAVWEQDVLHDTCHATDPSRHLKLNGHLEHKRVGSTDWSDYFCGRRMDERLTLVAEQMYARGKRVSAWGLWTRPVYAFIKFFVFKRGFLDGTFGLLIAQKAAVSAQLKYAALWTLQQEAQSRTTPAPELRPPSNRHPKPIALPEVNAEVVPVE